MKKILDASVMSKWFLEESGSAQALSYLTDFVNGKYTLVVPTLLFYELGNVFWKKNIPVVELSSIMQKFHAFSSDQFLKEDIGFDGFHNVYQTAQEYDITFYDASYVVLLQKYECEFITADEKLFRKLKGVFAKIRLL